MQNLTNDIILHQNIDGTEFIQFKEFPNIKHCYTLRKNDINVQIKNNDKSSLVASYENIGKALGFDYRNIVKPHQTHTDNVEIVKNVNQQFEEVDGVITNKENIFLCTTSADCTSLLFYDYKKNVIGDIHSGWRGTLKQIGKKAVKKMVEAYSCNPKDIICCISPCIKKCHFEVEEEVKNMFEAEFKYTIDTTLINKISLMEAGLKEENIIDSNICTVCNSDLFHSYRVDREMSGRNGAFIGMVSQ